MGVHKVESPREAREEAFAESGGAADAGETRYTAAALIASTRFAKYPRAVLRGLLKGDTYTIAEAEAMVTSFLGRGGN